MNPRISIIMPCFNAQANLAAAIDSVSNQTRTDWELIVIDDGSTDASAAIARDRAAGDSRIQVIEQPNRGAASARNAGLARARGRYLAFLDSDDFWDARFLAVMSAVLDAEPDTGIAYCGWQNYGLSGGRGEAFVPPDYEAMDKVEALLGGCRWPIHGALTRTALVTGAGGFDESLRSCMDYDLWLRIAPFTRLTLVPEVLAFYLHHEGEQITKNRVRMAMNHLRAQEKFVRAHPRELRRLGRAEVRRIMLGDLLRRGYEAYWMRDLEAARWIFRRVMRGGYGRPADWKYMLPSLLPLPLHRALIGLFGTGESA